MLTIILGILAMILFGFIAIKAEIYGRNYISALALFCVLISIAAILVSFTYPISGYTDWEPTDRKDLVPLYDLTSVSGTKGTIYLSISPSNVYTYCYKVDSEFDKYTSKEFITETVDGKYVLEIEDESIDIPYMQIYTRKGQKSIWALGLFSEQFKYVFYVPAGSISRGVNFS